MQPQLWQCNHSYGSVTVAMEELPLLWKCTGATASEDCEPETLKQRVPGGALAASDPGGGRGWISLTSCAISPLSVGGVRPLLQYETKCSSPRSWPE